MVSLLLASTRLGSASDVLARLAEGAALAASASLWMSMRQPVSRAASRAFWPSRPIASDSWKSGTTTRTAWLAAIDDLCGDRVRGRQRVADVRGRVLGPVDDVDLLAVQFGHDVAHPLAHRTDAGALGVQPGTELRTAILLRWPASRATPTISTLPSAISGTSSANSFLTRLGWVRLTVTCGPRMPRVTPTT